MAAFLQYLIYSIKKMHVNIFTLLDLSINEMHVL
jgi:hypothetical protein